MSSPFNKYEEIFLDLNHQLNSISVEGKKNFLKNEYFQKFNASIKRMNPKHLMLGYFTGLIILLLFIKPNFIKKEKKNNQDKKDEISFKKLLMWCSIFSIPIAIYIITNFKLN
jgi:hypothetical protein